MKNTIRVLFVTLAVLSLGAGIPAYAKTQTVRQSKNPTIRIRVGDAAATNVFTANGKFVVQNTAGELLFDLTKADTVAVTYVDGVYSATVGEVTKTSTVPVRVTPYKLAKTIQILSFENRPAWNTSLNDNTFYGSIEVVYSDHSQALLLVNDLSIEKYVRGIAEAGNDNDPDYLQTLLTAARTYAWFNVLHPTKHRYEPYVLDSTANDQVYRGEGFSARAPNIVAAQIATAKQVITYQGSVIVAPYFSQSDGRTRAWGEVWAGEYAWAQSVEDPGCVGGTVSGHGVGLSAAGARYFAAQGMGWQDILKYYYQGVEIGHGY